MKLNSILLITLTLLFLFSCKKKELAKVKTLEATNITESSAVLKGEIVSDGNSKIISSGAVLSLNTIPTINDIVIYDKENSISVQANGLEPNKTYYVRAFAENKSDISYGNQVKFKTTYTIVSYAGQGVTDIDGNNYSTIVLGNNQEWMAENLRTTNCSDGSIIPNITDESQWDNTNSPAWAYYDNDSQNDFPHGKLYNWYAVNDCAVCPSGWRVPTNEDWKELVVYLDPDSEFSGGNDAADKMKVIGTQYWNGPNENATNLVGFSAYPSGKLNGGFMGIKNSSYWWTQNESNSSDAYIKTNIQNNETLIGSSQSKKNGASIRCLKN